MFGPARPWRLVIALATLALLPALASTPGATAQLPPAAPGATAETRHLQLATSVTRPSAGRRVVLNLDVVLKPKMHVYAPDQPKDQDYMPIALTVARGDAYRLEQPRFPVAEKFFFAPLKETQHVYSKPFRVTQPIVLTRAAGAEPLTITGTVRYQACDDAICYVPQTVAVKWIIAATAATKGTTGGQEMRSSGSF